MPDLLRWPPRAALRWLTALALVATIGMFVFFARHDGPLSPYTIVSLELAWTPAQAGMLLAAWGQAGRQVARESLLLDFFFMPAYALLLAGLVVFEARRSAGRVQALGLRLAWAPFAAWALDIAENLALLRVLAVAAQAAPPLGPLVAAGLCASLKFLLLLAGVLYVIFALAVRLATRPVPKRA